MISASQTNANQQSPTSSKRAGPQIAEKRYGGGGAIQNTYAPPPYRQPVRPAYVIPYKHKSKKTYKHANKGSHSYYAAPSYAPSYAVPPFEHTNAYVKPYGSSYFPPSFTSSYGNSHGNSYGLSHSPTYGNPYRNSYGSSYSPSYHNSHGSSYPPAYGTSSYGVSTSYGSIYGSSENNYGSDYGSNYHHTSLPPLVTYGGFDHYQGPFYNGDWTPTIGPYNGPAYSQLLSVTGGSFGADDKPLYTPQYPPSSPTYGLLSDSF